MKLDIFNHILPSEYFARLKEIVPTSGCSHDTRCCRR